MKKAVLFGEHKTPGILAVLRARGFTHVVIYSAVDFDPVAEFGHDGVEIKLLDTGWTPEDVLGVLHAEQPDLAVANPYALGQEQLPQVYGRAAAGWDGPFVTHPVEFAQVACDKATFQETAEQRGWPVPTGKVCPDADAVTAAADALGFPLVVKEALAQAGGGRYHVASREELDAVLAADLAFPAVVQVFERGVEAGVELVSGGGTLRRWPVVSMGPLDSELNPSVRARMTPFALPSRAAAQLSGFLADVQDAFAPFGPWQVDFAVVDDGIVVLEINARLGGLSDLGIKGTGTNPYEVFTRAALGESLPEVASPALTIELPTTWVSGTDVPAPPEGVDVTTVTARRPTYPCFMNTDRLKLVANVREKEAGMSWLKELEVAGRLICPVESAVAQLETGFETQGSEVGVR